MRYLLAWAISMFVVAIIMLTQKKWTVRGMMVAVLAFVIIAMTNITLRYYGFDFFPPPVDASTTLVWRQNDNENAARNDCAIKT